MENYFDTEIKRLKKEILQLKYGGQKSAQALSTVVKTESLTLDLALSGSDEVTAMAAWEVTTKSEALVSATLDKYYDDITINDHWAPERSRSRKLHVFISSPTSFIIGITMRGDNSDVVSIRDQGGSVSMSATLTVRCIGEFTMERFV